MLDYELCKQLRDAGFPQEFGTGSLFYPRKTSKLPYVNGASIGYGEFTDALDYPSCVKVPTLSELIEACGNQSKDKPWGDDFGKFDFCLDYNKDYWSASYKDPNYHESWSISAHGTTTEIAVAKLWLALNNPVQLGEYGKHFICHCDPSGGFEHWCSDNCPGNQHKK